MNVNIFQNCSRYGGDFPLIKILENIRDGVYKDVVMRYREMLATVCKDEADGFKKTFTGFPVSTLYAGRRTKEHVVAYNGLIILDVDKVGEERAEELKAMAAKIPYTVFSFISPSGKGLKIGVKPVMSFEVNFAAHLRTFNHVKAFYERMLNVKVDTSGSDPGRLCFVSYDPETYINVDADVTELPAIDLINDAFPPVTDAGSLDVEGDDSFENEVFDDEDSVEYDKFRNLRRQVARKVGSYQKGARNNFLFELVIRCRRRGISYEETKDYCLKKFLDLSHEEIIRTVNSGYSNTNSSGNVEKVADKTVTDGHKMVTRGHKMVIDGHKMVTCDHQMTEKMVTRDHSVTINDQKTTEKGSKNAKISASVEKSASGGGKNGGLTNQEKTEEFINRFYTLHFNTVKNCPEFLVSRCRFSDGCTYKKLDEKERRRLCHLSRSWTNDCHTNRWEEMKDYYENSIYRLIAKTPEVPNINTHRLFELFRSDFCPRYNPFEDYFYRLPLWDGKTDFIGQLTASVKTEDQGFWEESFRKWIVGMVGCALDKNVNNQIMMILQSDRQGVGKSRWFRALIPAELSEYYKSSVLDVKSKEIGIQMAQLLLINFDELDALSSRDNNRVKETVSRYDSHERPPYGRNMERFNRCASLCATSNSQTLLSDLTGARRFCCNNVVDIDRGFEVNHAGIYSQALALFRSGYQYWFDVNEISLVNEHNEVFRLVSIEEELLMTYFRPAKANDPAGKWLTISEMLVHISQRTGMVMPPRSNQKMGTLLRREGYLWRKSNGRKLYFVYELSNDDIDSQHKEGVPQGPKPGLLF